MVLSRSCRWSSSRDWVLFITPECLEHLMCQVFQESVMNVQSRGEGCQEGDGSKFLWTLIYARHCAWRSITNHLLLTPLQPGEVGTLTHKKELGLARNQLPYPSSLACQRRSQDSPVGSHSSWYLTKAKRLDTLGFSRGGDASCQ